MEGGLEHAIDQFCKYYMTDLRIGNVGYSLVWECHHSLGGGVHFHFGVFGDVFRQSGKSA